MAFAVATVTAAGLLGAAVPALADSTGVTDKSIKIGFVGSMTGPAAIWGSGNMAGATLAFEETNAAGGVNGRKIEFITVDDETSAPKGIAGFNRLVQSDKVFAVFGPSSSAVGVPMKTTMANSGVPILIPSFSSPLMTEPPIANIFRVGPINDRMQGRGIANYLVDKEKLKKIAILRQSDEYGATGASSVAGRLKELGITPVANEVFNAADTDFTSQILRVRSSNPDAIVVYGYPAPSAIVTRQIREVGIKAEIIGSSATSNQNYPELVGKVGAGTKFVSNGEHLPESDAPAMKKFREAFQKRFPDLARQGRPALGDVLGYGGALTVVEGLRRAGKDLTRAGYMKALESLDGYETGVSMPTYLSATNHEGNTKMYIAVIKDDLTREVLPGAIDAK
ncbi:ABC transporter substrate-binding protein [Tardiphaga sp.]|uniref:ABC transporter substrate-binding protein n=1 Tax=Tardiphaga sp. TaxID=1926292 RepID=UPI0037DA77ED